MMLKREYLKGQPPKNILCFLILERHLVKLLILHYLHIETPRISVPDNEILVNNGDTARLVCNARGIPKPRISWFKGEIEVGRGLGTLYSNI